jgi:hypothetical protein
MRSFAPILAASLLAAVVGASTAAAGGKYPPAQKCVQYNPVTHQTKCYVKGTPVTPVARPLTPPNGSGSTNGGGTTPPVVTPPVPAPVVNGQITAEGFCVQTLQRGETFVQANVGSFNAGGDWFDLWSSQATVTTADGYVVTLLFEDGHGAIVAPNVPGVGLTCAQPYVSTDGVVANPDWLAGLEPIV